MDFFFAPRTSLAATRRVWTRNPKGLDSIKAVRFPEGVLRTTHGEDPANGHRRLGTVFAFVRPDPVGTHCAQTDERFVLSDEASPLKFHLASQDIFE